MGVSIKSKICALLDLQMVITKKKIAVQSCISVEGSKQWRAVVINACVRSVLFNNVFFLFVRFQTKVV